MKKPQAGFTIVELLIVVVVIAILATISMVAYNGIQDRARVSALTGSLMQAAKKMNVWRVDNPDQYPSSLADIQISDTDTLAYQYTYNTGAQSYCITATHASGLSYYISNTNSVSRPGVCSGYNLITWSKPSGAPPITLGPGAVVDTSVFRTSSASVRLGPNTSTKYLRNNPFSGTPGQIYTVSLWLKTDLNWNGLPGNSKIRFGDANNGNNLLTSCSYSGVKADWTQVNCSYTLSSGVSSVSITVANDGTIGNVWIDDVSLSLN